MPMSREYGEASTRLRAAPLTMSLKAGSISALVMTDPFNERRSPRSVRAKSSARDSTMAGASTRTMKSRQAKLWSLMLMPPR